MMDKRTRRRTHKKRYRSKAKSSNKSLKRKRRTKRVRPRRKPRQARRRSRKRLRRAKKQLADQTNRTEVLPSPPVYPQGLNIVGFIRAEMGIGESARLAARSANAAGIPFGLLDYPIKVSSRMLDDSWSHKELNEPLYNTNVFHINADFMAPALEHFGPSLPQNRYNIGYWHWELPDFPDEYADAFKLVQEVWTCSRFVADSISRKSPVPVITIPHGVTVQVSSEYNRSHFGLPSGRFLFLMMYDAQSSASRKNPQAAVEAFKLAFAKNDPRVGLVLKLNNAGFRPEEFAPIRQLAAEHTNIYLIDQSLSRLEVNSLLQCCDSFVSLHRAEGFGLGLAESMYLGKPVIGTNWSGNTEFMNSTNSCPVNYKLVQVGQDWGPYKSYQTWAEPDVQHAAAYMRRLADEPQWRAAVAANGKYTIRNEFSPLAVGQRMKARLVELGLLPV
ncbi:glycosyltransferase family 4 protein [Paenibacillus radicis (ex Gao et al. 2016)]|uniref:glycosyltransferase family 4 protein n=1 Tax=Paenibacillus radicis (ex Gao et al. 2016) TaxID=1737354 RepID=UPI001E2BAB4C|nr:glycosyltransferase family 4 protein [Paenibacillus radicis (ex Gao et al. 2016)]